MLLRGKSAAVRMGDAERVGQLFEFVDALVGKVVVIGVAKTSDEPVKSVARLQSNVVAKIIKSKFTGYSVFSGVGIPKKFTPGGVVLLGTYTVFPCAIGKVLF